MVAHAQPDCIEKCPVLRGSNGDHVQYVLDDKGQKTGRVQIIGDDGKASLSLPSLEPSPTSRVFRGGNSVYLTVLDICPKTTESCPLWDGYPESAVVDE